HVTGNKSLETEGKVDRVKGAVHNAAGDAKDAGKEAIEAVKNAPSKH
ncbi:MAG: CsbD-like, partial [Acidobacteriaceae bacterium]|nr:CsbD-like [Acidobacteriaceae bacterium]